MQLSQQLSGIAAVLYFSKSIFEEAGASEGASQGATVRPLLFIYGLIPSIQDSCQSYFKTRARRKDVTKEIIN